jgi:hypothetical protein
MVFKLGLEAQKHWRRLNGSALFQKMIAGVQFIDGEELQEQAAQLFLTGMLLGSHAQHLTISYIGEIPRGAYKSVIGPSTCFWCPVQHSNGGRTTGAIHYVLASAHSCRPPHACGRLGERHLGG